ncbi:vacuolar protein sorting-associated 35A-like protein [Actinidia rufa]|uniref:Vacuolar protein sorting-associated protein 35 n=1 Tax=Actinidia rufa TaxID=165716 RepID=A0A7J0EPU7_9ERIC|nr:vacuolar protein sorting-associated 35A-like protein [Actinidia rufa]
MISDGVEDEEKWLAAAITGLQTELLLHASRSGLEQSQRCPKILRSDALRTSDFTPFPHKYYELYMRAFDELRKLEMFFKEETRRGCSIIDLYELVQHAGNILPRLYLLCTVGSVYIKSKEAPAKDVLKDLVEMCRGIQHPVRGLFLRSYLSQISRDKLPDIGSEYEGDADTVTDAVEFVLQNFTENEQTLGADATSAIDLSGLQGPAREKERREKERSELRDLVGKNLHVLSQIEGVDLDMYRDTVLPRILEQVVNCKDELAQYYLMDCVIEAQVDMPIAGAVTLYSSLLTFTLHVHPDRLDYVDQILGACVKKLSGKGKLDDSRATKQIVALLSAPLEKYNDIETALKLSNYPRVMEHLDDGTNKVMAGVIIQSIIKNRTHISTADKVEALFELIKGLIKDSDEKLHDEIDEEDFNEEQNSVARLIQMLYNNDPEEMLKIICTVRKYILTGGPKRLPFTVPPLIFNSLKLVRRLQSQEENAAGEEVAPTPKKIFPILNQTIEALSAVPVPELALRLYLQCAEAANDCDLEPVAYEFFTQAYILYEEEISDSRAQVTAVHLIIGTLQRMHVFGVENRDTLTHKATGYSAKLLKKPDQCRAVYACSHLFWVDDSDSIKDGERVLLCLKRALRIANAAQQMSNATRGSSGSVTLFIEILNKYLYFFEKGNSEISVSVIQGLIELITTEMHSENMTPDPAADAFFASTLRYIQFQKQKEGALGAKYEPIKA